MLVLQSPSLRPSLLHLSIYTTIKIVWKPFYQKLPTTQVTYLAPTTGMETTSPKHGRSAKRQRTCSSQKPAEPSYRLTSGNWLCEPIEAFEKYLDNEGTHGILSPVASLEGLRHWQEVSWPLRMKL